MPTLDLTADVVTLTQQLCDIESVSHDEAAIADAIEAALRPLRHLEVVRRGNTVIARTDFGRDERVVLAGHIDTVPLTSDPANLPTRREQVGGVDVLWGRGTVDMKGGVAVQLKAALVEEPSRDITFLFYEAEEVDAVYNGLQLLAESDPDLLAADFAVLLEPTNAAVEGGCKGTMRVEVVTKGIAAHSARPWNGHNAIHDAHEVLAALAYVQTVLPGRELHVRDVAEGARPGLDLPAAQAFVAALDVPVGPKEGWTDVARFSALGIPAVNFGPGDPNLAHHDEERCPVEQITAAEAAVLRWLA